jgi:hypothetical protein
VISWLTCSQPGGFGWGIADRGYTPLAELVRNTQLPVFEQLGLRARVCCHNPGGIYGGQMLFDQFARAPDTLLGDYIAAWAEFIKSGGELITYLGFGDPRADEPPGKYLERSGAIRLAEAGHSIAIDSAAVKLPEDFDTALVSMLGDIGATVYAEGIPNSWGSRKLWAETPIMFDDRNPDAGGFIAAADHHAEKICIITGDGPNAAPDHKLRAAAALEAAGITPAVPLYHWISRGVDVAQRWRAAK